MDRRSFLQGMGAGALGALAGCAPAQGVGSARPLPAFEPDAEGFWRAVRARFPLLDRPVYLNTGGLGPAAQEVLDTVTRTTARLQEHCETGHDLFPAARQALAQFIGADPAEVCFTRNATEGNSIIAGGLALEAGDEVVFETHAHPGGSFPWLNQARRRGVRVVLFEPDPSAPDANLARLAAVVTGRTRVIQVSHITCTTGLVFPVEAMADFARSRGIWFHVDGAQAAGMVPLDLAAMGCDSYAFSGHKWLGGPPETGVLYIRRSRLEEVALIAAGAYSGELAHLPGELQLTQAASRHEYGTRNAGLIAGLAAAVGLQQEIGRERIAARGASLAGRIAEEAALIKGIEVLTPRHPSLRASMTTVRHARARAGALFEYLVRAHGLRCRPVTEQGLEAVRVSTHVFNSPAECERVVAALRLSVREL